MAAAVVDPSVRALAQPLLTALVAGERYLLAVLPQQQRRSVQLHQQRVDLSRVVLAQDTQQRIMKAAAVVVVASSEVAVDIVMVPSPMAAAAVAPVSHLEIV